MGTKRRIDEVKSKKMKNVKEVEVLDKKRVKITFKNNQEIVLCAMTEDYGYDAGLYIEEDTSNKGDNMEQGTHESLTLDCGLILEKVNYEKPMYRVYRGEEILVGVVSSTDELLVLVLENGEHIKVTEINNLYDNLRKLHNEFKDKGLSITNSSFLGFSY